MHQVTHPLIIGISSRALFDLDESHHVFEKEGLQAYRNYQIENENNPLQPGVAFSLVEKLLAIRHPQTAEALVEVILLSRNNADTGLRIFNSIEHHKLAISRAVFTQGESPYPYVSAFGAHLFLSSHAEDVAKALQAGVAAARILAGKIGKGHPQQLRIAFDGDSVLFSDESERIYQEHGLQAFTEHEKKLAKRPLAEGPFKGFLTALHHVQSVFPATDSPIRTALVTARSAPAHERVITTLRAWNIRIDEALFLGGLNKTDFLTAFGADFFFDDQTRFCDLASPYVATGHVPHGVRNATQ